METVTASILWPGSDVDVLTVFAEPTPEWIADPIDDEIILFRVVTEDLKETGAIAGVRVIGFLEFDRWDDLPKLPIRWQVPGQEPLSLEELLRREQQALLSTVARR